MNDALSLLIWVQWSVTAYTNCPTFNWLLSPLTHYQQLAWLSWARLWRWLSLVLSGCCCCFSLDTWNLLGEQNRLSHDTRSSVSGCAWARQMHIPKSGSIGITHLLIEATKLEMMQYLLDLMFEVISARNLSWRNFPSLTSRQPYSM
jgi:hypothetical protein